MLRSTRLHFNEISIKDLEKVHELNSLPETDEFNTLGIPETIAVTEKVLLGWIKACEQNPKTSDTYGIFLRESNQFIGVCGMKYGVSKYKNAEIWYKIHKDFWNLGYATEAAKELLRFGFEDLKLHRIEAGCDVDNIGSVKVLEKVGMIREGRTRKKLPIRGEWKDNYEYAILEEDWLSSIH